MVYLQNSGLKSDQFNCGIGTGWIGCARGTISCVGGAGSCTVGVGGITCNITDGLWGAGGPPSVMSNYIIGHAINKFRPNPTFNFKLVNWIYRWTKV